MCLDCSPASKENGILMSYAVGSVRPDTPFRIKFSSLLIMAFRNFANDSYFSRHAVKQSHCQRQHIVILHRHASQRGAARGDPCVMPSRICLNRRCALWSYRTTLLCDTVGTTRATWRQQYA